jgi:hypothetical protein
MDHMQNISELKPATAQPRPPIKIMTKSTPRKSGPAGKPDPRGLTREELRAIVADLLG